MGRDEIPYLHIQSPKGTEFYWTKSEPATLSRMKIVMQHFNTIVSSMFCGSVVFHVGQVAIKCKRFLRMTFCYKGRDWDNWKILNGV